MSCGWAGTRRTSAALSLAMALASAAPAVPVRDDLDARLSALRKAEQSARPPSPSRVGAELAAIGRGYLEAGRLGPAVEVLEETVGRFPDDSASLARLVLALARREDFEFARSYLDLAAEREEASRERDLYAEIGNLFSAAHHLDAASLAWELYRRAGGTDATVLGRLGRTKRELSASPGQRSLASDHFTIFGDESVPLADLARIEAALIAEYGRQASLFGADLGSPQVVIIHGGRRYFSMISIPDWVSGVFDGNIRVSLDLSRPYAPETEAVLSHELSHAFIRQLSGGRAPSWLHEGLAQWCSGRRIPRSDFRRELGAARPRTLADMEGNLAANFDPQRARANYAEALGLIEYLVQKRGEGSVFCLVRDFGDGAGLQEGLRREAQMTQAELVAGWRSWAGL